MRRLCLHTNRTERNLGLAVGTTKFRLRLCIERRILAGLLECGLLLGARYLFADEQGFRHEFYRPFSGALG